MVYGMLRNATSSYAIASPGAGIGIDDRGFTAIRVGDMTGDTSSDELDSHTIASVKAARA